MKTPLTILGMLAIAFGLLFAGQGAGLIMWPSSSFMLDQRIWMLWGGLLTVAGLLCIVLPRRR